jgi:DNA-binding HxlR family transcriptional regulator
MERQGISLPGEVAMDVLSGKWKCLMMWHLHDGTMRYGMKALVCPTNRIWALITDI